MSGRNQRVDNTNVSRDPEKILRDPKKMGNLVAQIKKTNKLLEDNGFKDYDDLVSYQSGVGAQARHTVSEVPYKAYTDRKEEETLSLYKELTDAVGDGVFQGLDSKKFIEFTKTRQDEAEALQFEKYVLDSLNPNDPYQMHLATDWFPEIFEKRLETITSVADKYRRLAHMWVYGIESNADMALTYHISEGNEVFDGNVLAKIIGYDPDSQKAAQDRANDGFMDDKRVNAAENAYNPTNSVDFRNPLSIVDGGRVKINRGANFRPDTVVTGTAFRSGLPN